MNDNLINRTKIKLRSEFYLMNDDWLRDCVEYCVQVQENSTDEDILDFVKMQWQLSDLREINNINGCLPPNISQQKSTILSGKYILQMEQMYDIATSKYKQLGEIRKTECSEIENSDDMEDFDNSEPIKKKMIQIKLTDGKQDIIGIEYSYIARLNNMFLPGYKVMLIGPIRCRKGVLLLEEGTLKGIGGEVDNLLIPNALENILARALNLKENPDPYNDNERKPEIVENQQEKPKNKDEEPELLFEEDFDIDFGEISKIESENQSEKINEKFGCKIDVEIFNLECTNKMGNLKKQKEKESQKKETCIVKKDDHLANGTPKKTTGFQTFPEGNSDTEDDDILVIFEDDTTKRARAVQKNSQNKKEEKQVFEISKLQERIPECSITPIAGKRSQCESPPGVTILKKGRVDGKITDIIANRSNIQEQVTCVKNQEKPNEVEEKFCDFIKCVLEERKTNETEYKVIRGQVETLGKLSYKDFLWIIDAVISDGTGKIDVSFSNQVLENLLGFSVQEFLRKRKLKKNSEIDHELRTALRVAENELNNMDDLLEIVFSPGNKPKVIKVTSLTEQQKKIIDKQLKNFLEKKS